MKPLSVALLAAALLCDSTLAARADTLYTEYLIDSTGVQDGYLTFGISAPPPATGAYTCTAEFVRGCMLDTLNVFVDPDLPNLPIFTLLWARNNSSVNFTNGVLTGISATFLIGDQGYGPNTTFALGGSQYSETTFSVFHPPPYSQLVLQGTLSPTPAAATTPEPGSLALLATGLLSGLATLRRRLSPPLPRLSMVSS